MDLIRCGWLTNDPIYIKYHDEEWGKPITDATLLFEMLCLEGQQAGLSWLTILKKRDNYRNTFHNFNPYKIASMNNKDVTKCLENSGIVRHKLKIEAIINNAKCYIDMQEKGVDFKDFIWSFVNNKPIVNDWQSIQQIPTETDISIKLSKALKSKGFKFVGSTICYAFMQASGLVDDHIVTCFCRTKN